MNIMYEKKHQILKMDKGEKRTSMNGTIDNRQESLNEIDIQRFLKLGQSTSVCTLPLVNADA